MTDILMIAEVPPILQCVPPPKGLTVHLLPLAEFQRREEWYAAHHDALAERFRRRGLRARIESKSDWVIVAVAENDASYRGSILIVEVGAKWIVEYVITETTFENQGIGSAMMHHLLVSAKERQIAWLILNCNPEKEHGKLPKLYGKFGFRQLL